MISWEKIGQTIWGEWITGELTMQICSNLSLESISISKQLLLIVQQLLACLCRKFLILCCWQKIVNRGAQRLHGYDALSTMASTGQASWQNPQ